MNTEVKALTEEEENSGQIFPKILVAVDSLDKVTETLEKAIQLAQTYGSNLMIFHCIQEDTAAMVEIDPFTDITAYSGVHIREMVEIKRKLREELREKMLSCLNSLCSKATEKGIATEFDYKVGDAGKEICNLAANWGADLIVIGRRGRKGLTEMLLGSVSNYVLHNAHCSVLVIQH